MASSISHHPPVYYKPQGRYVHCSAIVDGKQYTYGGRYGAGRSPPLSVVEIFHLVTEKWQQMPTTGETPPGHIGASCAMIGAHIFHFGGLDGSGRYYNTIHQFDTKVLRWNPVNTTNPREAPAAKVNSGMISYDDNLLVTSGGYVQDKRHPSGEYVPNPKYKGYGWTNKVQCFHVDSSESC